MNVRFEPADEPGRPRSREEHLMNIAARVLDTAHGIRRNRMRRGRAGEFENVLIPWPRFIALLDAVEGAFPGSLERTLKSTEDAHQTRETERKNRKTR